MFFSAKNVTEFNGVKVFMSHDDIKKNGYIEKYKQ